jgi:electron transfer flavoprotein beta subunit
VTLHVAVAQKWVDHRPEVDPLTGAVTTDPRTSGPSPADQAALEWALRAAEAWGGDVTVITAGPPAAEAMLRDGLAAGAAGAVRVDLDQSASSGAVAAALSPALAGVDLVLCGDWSLDRGSGAVPAFLAAHLGAAQALGCVDLTLTSTSGQLRVERRLDGGRRERLVVGAPAVVSVEGRTARLRRAPLDGVLGARTAPIQVLAAPAAARCTGAPPACAPYRPRARTLPPPADPDARRRILALTGALSDRTPPQLLHLDPEEAADRILDQLRAWGYIG